MIASRTAALEQLEAAEALLAESKGGASVALARAEGAEAEAEAAKGELQARARVRHHPEGGDPGLLFFSFVFLLF